MPGIKFLQRYHVIYFLKICWTFFGEEGEKNLLFSCDGKNGRAALGLQMCLKELSPSQKPCSWGWKHLQKGQAAAELPKSSLPKGYWYYQPNGEVLDPVACSRQINAAPALDLQPA